MISRGWRRASRTQVQETLKEVLKHTILALNPSLALQYVSTFLPKSASEYPEHIIS
jgi:hypothetical protein